MPTLEHNALVEMFREKPELVAHFLARLFDVEVPPHASIEVVESSLDQLLPIEFRADLVLELRNEEGATVLAIVLEAQRDRDPDKLYSWPVYVIVVRAKKRCPTIVLVIAPDAAVAAWAAQSIDLGLGLGMLRPLVLGPATVPVVTDPAAAEQDVELAVLSAMAHLHGPNGLSVAHAAMLALSRLDRDHAVVYSHVIWTALGEPGQRALEALLMQRQIEGTATFPPFMQRLFDLGRAEGELEGELKGELEGKRSALLRLAARAGVPLTGADHARVQACTDAETLDRWIDNVLGAKSAAELFS